MDTFELTILIVFVFGFAVILYLILRDPIYMFKSFLRGLKSDGNWKAKILFSPIWLPIWIIDKIFGFKLYIKEFEDASRPEKISFTEYDKYLLINTPDLKRIEKVIQSFVKSYDKKEYDYKLNGACLKISDFEENTVLKIENEIEFKSFNTLIQYMDNSAPKETVYNVKGILINKSERSKSYFIFHDTAFVLKLIGKTYWNKKMYVDIDPETELNETIYYNSNMDYFKKIDFDKFENEINRLKFKEIKLKPST